MPTIHKNCNHIMKGAFPIFTMISVWLIVTLHHSISHAFSSSSSLISISNQKLRNSRTTPATILYGGEGEADAYSWKEEQFEIEVKLTVPPRTTTKDIKFKCRAESIDLRLVNSDAKDDGNVILLDGARNMRGKICVDGTFWSIEGPQDKEREVTVTIEKHFVPVSSVGGTQTYDTLTDFDWGGLYPNDEDEVTFRKYEKAEELNVREYAANLGVDIDDIDMNKVNKTMFGAGLDTNTVMDNDNDNDDELADENDITDDKGFHFNITQATLEQLTKVGLAKEIVQQGDGSEYELGNGGSLSEDKIFSMLGKGISDEELRSAGIVGESNIPKLWEIQTVPVDDVAPGSEGGIIESEIVEQEISTADSVVTVNEVNVVENEKKVDSQIKEETYAADPISGLTVARLKEILREQGLKVSGNKQELRDRLKSHVNALLFKEELDT